MRSRVRPKPSSMTFSLCIEAYLRAQSRIIDLREKPEPKPEPCEPRQLGDQPE
jgi:hypothetical protein